MYFNPPDCHAVIGLGFGDEGKGLTVNNLCRTLPNALVIRYSGGQQAGHTVTLSDGTSHVFSNFGSGTLQGCATYWSKYCTVDPVGIRKEHSILKRMNGNPYLYIDRNCPVTTPWDKWYNRNHSKAMVHGTCGLGVGATLKREAAGCSFLASDLDSPITIIKMKIEAIERYYLQKTGSLFVIPDNLIKDFMDSCHFIPNQGGIHLVNGCRPFSVGSYDNFIFEGSQGLLLDQNIGFYPNVTPSNTGAKNIVEMGYEPGLYLVTRAYQTRHGAGPMTNENFTNDFIKVNPKETNTQNVYQGKFRRTALDLDLLRYGISRDSYIRAADSNQKRLVVTCLDQMEKFAYSKGGWISFHDDEESFLRGISQYLKISHVLACNGPEGNFKAYEFDHE